MHLHITAKRILALMLALLTVSTLVAAAEMGMVSGKNARIYSDDSLTGENAPVRQYTLVNVENVKNGVARISANGYTVYIDEDMLTVFDPDDVREMEFAKTASVYQYPDTSSRSARVRKGTTVNVLAVINNVAVIEKDGVMAYTYLSALTSPTEIIYESYEVEVTADSLKVYASASTSGNVIATLKKGDVVTLTARNDKWAIIEKNGVKGCCLVSGIKKYAPPADDPEDDVVYADYEVIVTKSSLKVYNGASTSAKHIATLHEGDVVNLVAYNSEWAIIEKNGVNGCCSVSGIEKYEMDAVVYDTYDVVVSADSLKLYKGASTSSKVVKTLKKGDRATLTAYNSRWAVIEIDGVKGCCLISGIEKYVEPMAAIFASDKYTNEQKVYYFLVNEMDYSPAAACGILANIKCESTFRPTAYNPNGGSYGICQWLGGRYTRLQEWCAENGYDHTTLEGQCWYLKYELENKYTKVHNFMKGVENTPTGAYDAGYYYCYHFEVPANRGSVSIKRGNMAKDDFWPKYCK